MKQLKIGMFAIASLVALVCAPIAHAQDVFTVTHGGYTYTVTFFDTISTSNNDPTFTDAGIITLTSTGPQPNLNGPWAMLNNQSWYNLNGNMPSVSYLVDQGPSSILTSLSGDPADLSRYLEGETYADAELTYSGNAQETGGPYFRYMVTVSPPVADGTNCYVFFNASGNSDGVATTTGSVSSAGGLGGGGVQGVAGGKKVIETNSANIQVIAPGVFTGSVAYCCTPGAILMNSSQSGVGYTSIYWYWQIIPADCTD
jgi:hypothetical protein